jgi:hypothetical protein
VGERLIPVCSSIVSSPSPYRRPSYEVARHGARSAQVEYDEEPPVAPEIRRTALWVRLVVGGLALIAVVATAVLGGFDQVAANDDPSKLPVVAVDAEFNGGPWLITVESAQIGRNLRDYHPSNEGDLVLQVNVRIARTDNCLCSVLRAVEVKGVPGVKQDPGKDTTPADTTRSLRDNSLVLEAQIGLPVRVAYLWDVAAGTPVPKEITVVVSGAIRRYQNFRFLGTTIEIHEPKATVTVPVVDRTVAA